MLDFELFGSSEADTEISGDILGKLALQAGDIGDGAFVALAPELGASGDVNQFCLYDDAITFMKKAAGEDGFDFEIAADAAGVKLRPMIARDGGPSHDVERAEMGKIVDDLFGDAVA